MGQNNQKDQKGPKKTAAVRLVQNNQNNQKIWSPHNSESAFFLGHPVHCFGWYNREVAISNVGGLLREPDLMRL